MKFIKNNSKDKLDQKIEYTKTPYKKYDSNTKYISGMAYMTIGGLAPIVLE